MGKKTILSAPVFENLLSHLVEIEENKTKIIEEYFPIPSKERDELFELIESYTEKVGSIVNNVKISNEADNNCPFISIGSKVEIQDMDSKEVLQYKIVPPFQQDIKADSVSYLSPLGKALLLKKIGDIILVNVPMGVCRYSIKSIKIA